LPERGSPLTRCLDPSALGTPVVAVEAVRRTIARVLARLGGSIEAALAGRAEAIRPGEAVSVQDAADALRLAQIFLSDVTGPPETDHEHQRRTSTLHALDHTSRLTDIAKAEFIPARWGRTGGHRRREAVHGSDAKLRRDCAGGGGIAPHY